METRSWFTLILVGLAGCTQPPIASLSEPVSTAPPAPAPPSARPDPQQGPRKLKLNLTLDSPQDLKVAIGDQVTQGQVLSDRASTRTRIEHQRQDLHLQLKYLQPQTTQAIPVNTATEFARIQQAELKVQQARAAISQFQAQSPWTDHAWATLPLNQDSAQLLQLQHQLQTAQAELDLATAQLHEARTAQKLKSEQADTALQRALLLSQLYELDAKLQQLGVVRAPYAGKIKAIKWLSQTNQELQVQLTLAIDPNASPALSASSASPAPIASHPDLWQVLSIHDGDTLKVRQGQRTERIRMACIDAPELKQPLGRQSRDHLRALISQAGNQVTLKIVDTDRYGRQVAGVYTPDGTFVQAQQAQAGMVYIYHQYLSNCPDADAVVQGETISKQQRLGIWSGNHQPPWEYRKAKR